MSHHKSAEAQKAGPGSHRETAGVQGGEGESTRGGFGELLSGLLGSLEPGPGGTDPGGTDPGGLLGGLLGHAGGVGGIDLGSLLGGVLGAPAGGDLDVNGLAEQSGVSPEVIQAAVPLVLGALLPRSGHPAAGVELGGARSHSAGLADLASALLSGKPIGPQLLHATGLPQQLAQCTGLDLSHAGTVIENILKALQIRPSGPALRPRRKPGESPDTAPLKPATKPRPSGVETRPRPKVTGSQPKPKPKPAAGKDKTRPSTGRPRGGRA